MSWTGQQSRRCSTQSTLVALQTSFYQVDALHYHTNLMQWQQVYILKRPESAHRAGFTFMFLEGFCLCTVVAADWLNSFSLEEKVHLFHCFFAEAPTGILLPTLVT